MAFSTLLTFFMVPATYVLIERARERRAEGRPLHAGVVPVAGGR
jgi:hypothetical protein